MPSITRRNADVRKELEHYLATMEANVAELPHFEVPRQSIRNVLQVIRDSSVEQDLHQANKQQASKRHQAAQEEGRKLITLARVMLRQHYGNRSEKLTEFGLQPFRRRSRTVTVEAKPGKPAASAPAVQEPKAPESED